MSSNVEKFNKEYEKYKQDNAAQRALTVKAVDDFRESVRPVYGSKYFSHIGVPIDDITARKLMPMLFEEDAKKYDHEVYIKQTDDANELFRKIVAVRETAAKEGLRIMNGE